LRKGSNLTNIFQMGWNQKLVEDLACSCLDKTGFQEPGYVCTSGWHHPRCWRFTYARVFQPAHLETWKVSTPPAGTMWRSHKLSASIRWMKWARWDVDVMSTAGWCLPRRYARNLTMAHMTPTPGQLLQKISRMPWTFHTFETENVNSWDFQFCQVSPLQVAEKFTLTLKKVRGVKESPQQKSEAVEKILQVWSIENRDTSGYPRST